MGVFDVHCAVSGIALKGEAQLVLLAEVEGRWTPIAAPIRGTYDRLGGIDDDPGFAAFRGFLRDVTGTADLEDALQALRDDEGVWRGRRLSYALVDAGVYDALPEELGSAEPELPDGLLRPWKARVSDVVPIDVEDGGQYTGLRGASGCQERVDVARDRFALEPRLLAAIDANARAWAELDGDSR